VSKNQQTATNNLKYFMTMHLCCTKRIKPTSARVDM